MTFQVQEFQTPKNGSNSNECQDAIAWDKDNGIYAIADGVSDSAFQQKWARLLVDSFVEKARTGEPITPVWIMQWLEAQQQIWQSQVKVDAVSWHGKMKAEKVGAEATFMGIRMKADRRSWSGIVIGDCNLFHFNRECKFVQSIPFHRSDEFSNATQAFSSIKKDHKPTLSQIKIIEGTIETGDYLILTTDAMARWMLLRLEGKKNPLREIPTKDNPVAFHDWVKTQRQSQRIKDDDTSLLMIQADPEKVQEPIPVTNDVAVQTQALQPSGSTTQGKVSSKPQKSAGVPVSLYIVSVLTVLIAGLFAGSLFQRYQNSLELQSKILTPLVQMANAKLPNQDGYKQGLYSYILAIDRVNGRVLICKADPAAPVCKTGR